MFRRLLAFGGVLAAAGPLFAQQELTFTDVTADAGMWDVPTACGVTVEDVDNDGDLDLLMANHGSENALFLNEGPLRFRGRTLIGGSLATEALVPGDVDGDGSLDLLSCAWGGPLTLLKGRGNGRFTEATEGSGLLLLPEGQCSGASFGDLDADGDLDLYVPAWETGDRLYLNENGQFRDATPTSGLPEVPNGEASLMADFNDDGRLDIYVARLKVGVSSLYLNQGEGRFDDASTRTDVFGLGGQLGACAFDADGDEDLDLLLVRGLFSEDAPHNLLINEGEAHFIDETPPEWRDEPCRNFTVCVGDVDNDGDLDAFRSAPQGCALWLNDGQGAFTRVLEEMVWNELPGSGAVLCDLDDDGDLDILVRVGSTFEEPADEGRPGGGEFLFRNELNNDGWLKVRPVDQRGSRFCHGAQVRVYEAGGLGDPEHFVARRDLTSLCGWVSYGPFVAHFGLKPERTYDVEVRFADGSRGTAPGVKPGRTVEVTAE